MMTRSDRIRAHIYGRRMTYKRESWMHWHMEVTDGKKIVHADDCRDLARLHDEATQSVASFRTLARQGHKFRSWRELVDEAGGNL
jgi:hypothetical protein